jgi:hypothetical protein
VVDGFSEQTGELTAGLVLPPQVLVSMDAHPPLSVVYKGDSRACQFRLSL